MDFSYNFFPGKKIILPKDNDVILEKKRTAHRIYIGNEERWQYFDSIQVIGGVFQAQYYISAVGTAPMTAKQVTDQILSGLKSMI